MGVLLSITCLKQKQRWIIDDDGYFFTSKIFIMVTMVLTEQSEITAREKHKINLRP